MEALHARSIKGADIVIDEQKLEPFIAGLRGSVLRPGAADYDDARVLFNRMIDKRPALIVQCSGVADVIDCVNFARENNLLVAVRGGGHNVAGNASCDGGIMIDLSVMNAVWVDPINQVGHAQGGATWGDIDRETQVFGLAAPGGIVSTTGVGGLTLGGGLGWLRNKYGMSLDNLVGVEIVTADGALLTANETTNSDLFWAVRGGGGNFGVVTSFEFQLHPVGPTVFAVITMYPVDQARTIMPKWRDFMLTAPDEVTSNAMIMTVPESPMFEARNHGKRVIAPIAMYAGAPEEGARVLQSFRELGTPLEDHSGILPYRAFQSAFDPFFPKGELYHYWKSLDLSGLDSEVINAIVDRAAAPLSPAAIVDVWRMGGAVARVRPHETAYGDRSAPFLLVFNTVWDDSADTEKNIAWTRTFWSDMRRYSSGGLYLNFPGQYEEGQDLMRDAFGTENYNRLVQIKNKYDPTNLFRLNQNILPTV